MVYLLTINALSTVFPAREEYRRGRQPGKAGKKKTITAREPLFKVVYDK